MRRPVEHNVDHSEVFPEGLHIPPAFVVEFERVLSTTGHNTITLQKYQRLAHGVSPVARVHFADKDGELHSVILKHVPFNRFPAAHWKELDVEFREERLAYHFLQKMEHFGRHPLLLAESETGMLLFEDLGNQDVLPERSFEVLIRQLADSFAALHAGSRLLMDEYLTLRKSHGLGSQEDDQRLRGLPGRRKQAQDGTGELRRLMEQHGLEMAPETETDIQADCKSIAHPGPFLAFIHDDIANYRQTFEVGDDLFFLDWEEAKFSHSLLDLTYPLLGKIERDVVQRYYLWICPGFPMALAEAYRKRLQDSHQRFFSDQQWHSGLDAALCFSFLVILGRAVDLRERGKPLAFPEHDYKALLNRLLELLPAPSHFPALRHDLQRLRDTM